MLTYWKVNRFSRLLHFYVQKAVFLAESFIFLLLPGWWLKTCSDQTSEQMALFERFRGKLRTHLFSQLQQHDTGLPPLISIMLFQLDSLEITREPWTPTFLEVWFFFFFFSIYLETENFPLQNSSCEATTILFQEKRLLHLWFRKGW